MGAECARPVQNECKEIGHVKGTMTIHWKLSEKCVFERAEKQHEHVRVSLCLFVLGPLLFLSREGRTLTQL